MENIFLLDADETIFDFQAACHCALKESFSKNNLQWKDEYFPIYKKINDSLWSQLEKGEITREYLLSTRFFKFLNAIEKNGDIVKINSDYSKGLGNYAQLFLGAEEFLKELSTLGKIYIITNGGFEVQKNRLNRCGIYNYVQNAFISEKIGADKPSLLFAEYVKKNVPNFCDENVLVIGDSFSSDVALAKNAGWNCIWYNQKSFSHTYNNKNIFSAKTYEDIIKIIKNNYSENLL